LRFCFSPLPASLLLGAGCSVSGNIRESLCYWLAWLETCILILGFFISLSVVAPSFKAADLIKLLGVGTVAIGFAFQKILQNSPAGILLLLQEPFQLGDFIRITGIEGTVSDIQSRATVVSTKEGRRVVIANAVIFTSPVAVESPAGKAA
jgi:small conductance mechanosensitive channel